MLSSLLKFNHKSCQVQRIKKSKIMAHCSLKFSIAIHGGAGVIDTSNDEVNCKALQGLRNALDAGIICLKSGGSATDAVELAVMSLEDNPSFNAGKGAVYAAGGHHELEASIMLSDMRCGAAVLLRRVKNPIKLARKVMEETPHIMLSGEDAEALAGKVGLDLVENSYFNTPSRLKQWEQYKDIGPTRQEQIAQHTQTVGAVAIDSEGRLAAATSTGGRSNKWDGRIGDTPIIGAGNYASPLVAVSGTGVGEQFIRHTVCHDIHARMAYGKKSVSEAAHEVIWKVLGEGDGGVIAVDKEYNIVLDFNCEGMYRGCADSNGRYEVGILRETEA